MPIFKKDFHLFWSALPGPSGEEACPWAKVKDKALGESHKCKVGHSKGETLKAEEQRGMTGRSWAEPAAGSAWRPANLLNLQHTQR